MGVRIAIDDFGVGYSLLAQIKRFPIDTLKVARSFMRDLGENAENRSITEAIIAMGKTLSLTVCRRRRRDPGTAELEATMHVTSCRVSTSAKPSRTTSSLISCASACGARRQPMLTVNQIHKSLGALSDRYERLR
jgi:predicted signal transduction protein with EAL and GGDEF domain